MSISAAAVAVSAIIYPIASEHPWLTGSFILIGVIYIVMGVNSKCPSCKKWFADKETGITKTDARTGFHVRDVTTETKNASGEVIAHHTTQQQFRVLAETWKKDYKCPYCGHKWSETFVTHTEDFDE